jgi:hypothetical protein
MFPGLFVSLFKADDILAFVYKVVICDLDAGTRDRSRIYGPTRERRLCNGQSNL